MRRYLLMIALTCAFTACKKTHVAPVATGLFGKWELRRTLFNSMDSTFSIGNGNAFQFNSDSTYINFFRGEENAHGTFHIRKKHYVVGQQAYDEIIFDSSPTGDLFLLLGTKLTIGSNEAGRVEAHYEKVPG